MCGGMKNVSLFNLRLQHSCILRLPPQLFPFLYFVKGHLGCCSLDAPVVWQSGDGNACWSACCCPERGLGVGLKEL